MFQFAEMGRAWVPVTLPMGGEGDGGEVEIKLLATLHTRKELRARERELTARMTRRGLGQQADLKSGDDVVGLLDVTVETEDGDIEDLLARVHDWKGVGDADGALDFGRERFAAMLEQDWIFKPVRSALFRAAREGVRKNSSPGRAGSQAPAQA